MLKGIDSDTAAAYFGYRLVEPPTFPRCYLIVIAGIAAEDRNSMGHRSCLVTEMLNNWQNGPNESEYPEYPGAKEDGIRGPVSGGQRGLKYGLREAGQETAPG